MKSKIFVFLLFCFIPVYAQLSLNIGVGNDFYEIPAIERINFELWNGTPAYFERTEIVNPLYFNLQIEYQSSSFIYGLHLAGAYKKYHIEYIYFPTSLSFDDVENKEDVPWARIEINGIFLYELPVSEKFSIQTGLGGGMQIMPPVVSDKFIYETTMNKALSLDFSDDIELEYLPNAKFIARAKFKLNEIFSISAETNYLFLFKGGKYEQPANFFTAAIFIGVTF